MNGGGGLGIPGHGERSASEADAKKDRESVGQTPANTAHAPFPASAEDYQSGRWGEHVGDGLDDGFGLGRDGRSEKSGRKRVANCRSKRSGWWAISWVIGGTNTRPCGR